jgi:hypothetical protein
VAKGGSGITESVFKKEAIVKPSSGEAKLEFEGSAKLAGGDFEINGQRPVIILGEGELNGFLKELE